jgi:hypothetical protein
LPDNQARALVFYRLTSISFPPTQQHIPRLNTHTAILCPEMLTAPVYLANGVFPGALKRRNHG